MPIHIHKNCFNVLYNARRKNFQKKQNIFQSRKMFCIIFFIKKFTVTFLQTNFICKKVLDGECFFILASSPSACLREIGSCRRTGEHVLHMCEVCLSRIGVEDRIVLRLLGQATSFKNRTPCLEN